MSGDGNCLFYAVSQALLQKHDHSTLLQRLGCSSEVDVMELARVLWHATVAEWLGENSPHYQSYLTHDQNMPVLILLPISSIPSDSHPLFIAYNQDGSGHYDAVCPLDAIFEDRENIHPVQLQVEKCTCGRNSSKGVSSLYHYSTKCPCFKAEKACSSMCRYKGCKNPHGQQSDVNHAVTCTSLRRENEIGMIHRLIPSEARRQPNL